MSEAQIASLRPGERTVPEPARQVPACGDGNCVVARMTRADLEARRLKAEELLSASITQAEIARRLGVSRTAVTRWVRRIESGAGMARRLSTGRPRRVGMERLLAIYLQKPSWRGKEFSDAVFAAFGTRYDVDHCYRLFARLDAREAEEAKKAKAAAQ